MSHRREWNVTLRRWLLPPAACSWRLSPKALAASEVELTLIGRNLLDEHHAESGTATSLSSLLVEIERSVYAQVTLVR